MKASYETVERLVDEAQMSTCAITDVLDGMGISGAVLPGQLERRAGKTGLTFGTAYTVSWVGVRKGPRIHDPSPSTWQQVRGFLVPEISDGQGQVYVAGAGALLTHAALAGGMSVTYLLEQVGFHAVVLGGAVRDRAVVEAMHRPVVASNFIPTDTQGAYRVSETGTECRIGDVRVTTGDWVFTDGNGTVVVRDDVIVDVLEKAVEVERAEASILQQIRSGRSLAEIIDEGGQI